MIKDYINILKSFVLFQKQTSYLPRTVQIDLTTYCNLNCKMCEANKVLVTGEQKKHLSFDEFKYVIDTVRPLSVNMATSGEPFLNPDVFRMIEYAKNKKVQTIISTNFILNKEIIKNIALSGLDILKISIDGAIKETYEEIRGSHFEQLKENILYFNSIKINDKRKSPFVRFNFVIMKQNYKEIKNYINFADQYNVKHIYFYALDTREYDESKKKELINGIDLEFLYKELKFALKASHEKGITTNIENLIYNYDIVKSIYLQADRNNLYLRRCMLPWLGLYVSVNGMTSPCCIMYPDENRSLGNIFKEDIKNIWNGSKIQEMRHNFWNHKNYHIYEGCKYCVPMDFQNLLRASRTFPGFVKGLLKK